MKNLHTDVGSRAPVLEVSITLSSNMTRDTNGGTTVGNTRAEVANVASLVTTGETKVVVFSVDGNVLVVPLAQFLDGSLDGLHASGFTHRLGAVVGVAASAIPVTLEGLGVERDLDAPLLGNTDEEVASHPEVVTHGNALARTNLELPLRGHDLGVDAANVDASVQACAVVGLNQITGKDLASTYN